MYLSQEFKINVLGSCGYMYVFIFTLLITVTELHIALGTL